MLERVKTAAELPPAMLVVAAIPDDSDDAVEARLLTVPDSCWFSVVLTDCKVDDTVLVDACSCAYVRPSTPLDATGTA